MLKLISNRVSANRYNPHKQKFWGSQFLKVSAQKPKCLRAAVLKIVYKLFLLYKVYF